MGTRFFCSTCAPPHALAAREPVRRRRPPRGALGALHFARHSCGATLPPCARHVSLSGFFLNNVKPARILWGEPSHTSRVAMLRVKPYPGRGVIENNDSTAR